MSISPDAIPTTEEALAPFLTQPVKDGIADYLATGRNQTLFLMAIFRGDSVGAERYADIDSVHYLEHIRAYCNAVLPPTIWGRPTLVTAWVTGNGHTEIP